MKRAVPKLLPVMLLTFAGFARAADWAQFRGPGGAAVAKDAAVVPAEWGDGKNLAWKAALPGPGSSSPIVVGDRVYVTCYTGYGVDGQQGGDPSKLKRLLVCLDRKDGNARWTSSVDAILPEDPYRGFLTEHGYASSTPASDGTSVFCFFGKSGVVAFDAASGKQLWRTIVGKESDKRGWGSAASPVLYKDLVIVNASSESQSIRALDKKTGKEVWKAEAVALELCFGTPALVQLPNGATELAIAVPGELWGLNPDSGKLQWYASTRVAGNVAPSVVAADGVVYLTGGFESRGTMAVRAGGKGDVTRSHVLWSISDSSYIPSPVALDGKLYWVDDNGRAACLDAASGNVINQQRLQLRGSSRRGKAVYASVVAAGDKLIAVTRTSGAFVLGATPSLQVLAINRLGDESDFNPTPAVAGGQLFLRSNRALYCIGKP
jgi:outer membrane protein assembly factor BamB